ncbi:zinc finger protein 385B isoform X4 [Dendrobates tinctorius]|uniref:zinc finger protein 385B isoform X4 n=1 Tax=Dendrobates tinctorius TaxID=92724 RepID=UPI003CC96EC2
MATANITSCQVKTCSFSIPALHMLSTFILTFFDLTKMATATITSCQVKTCSFSIPALHMLSTFIQTFLTSLRWRWPFPPFPPLPHPIRKCLTVFNITALSHMHFRPPPHLTRFRTQGSTCHTTALPALVRTPSLVVQPSLDMKPFVSFPMENSSAVGLFPNFNTSQAEAHYKGSKHAKKLKALESTKNKQKTGSPKDSTKAITSSTASNKSGEEERLKASSSISHSMAEIRSFIAKSEVALTAVIPAALVKTTNGSVISVSESEEEKAKKLLYCSLCKVAVNSLSQLEAHNTGSKHKTMLEARNGAGPIKSYPRSGSRLKLQNGSKGSGLQNKTFHCEICDVHVNSEIQLKQHISSRRHKDRVAGKPMKPKYSPYNKLQRSPSILAAKLAFQKEMIKPLTPTFLSSPLAAAVTSTLSLPPRAHNSLFQGSGLPPTFLRPAHASIRATTASILFAPY